MPGQVQPTSGLQGFWAQIQALTQRITSLETWQRTPRFLQLRSAQQVETQFGTFSFTLTGVGWSGPYTVNWPAPFATATLGAWYSLQPAGANATITSSEITTAGLTASGFHLNVNSTLVQTVNGYFLVLGN